MARGSAVAICAALVALPSAVSAQVALVERVRTQVGVTVESRPTPLAPPAPAPAPASQPRIEDYHVDVIPELALLRDTPRTRLSLTYTLTAAAHTFYPSGLGNRLAFAGAFDLSRRTTLTVGAAIAQTSLNTLLLAQPTAGATTQLLPTTSTKLVTANVTQGIAHDLSPRVRLDQHATATVFSTLAPTPPLDSLFATLGGGIDRVWIRDALGAEASVGYSKVDAAAPTPNQQNLIIAAGPRWRHDWSPSLSSLVAAGVSALERVDRKVKPLYAPFARGTLVYISGDSTVDLLVGTAITPNALTGQAVQAHQATLHALTPISMRAQVFVGASVGYARSTLLDRVNAANAVRFDTALADVEVFWRPLPVLQVFARYTLLDQRGDAPSSATGAPAMNPSFLRQAGLLGFIVTSRPPGTPARGGAPQRVDGGDGAPRAPAPRGRPEGTDQADETEEATP